MNAKQLVRTALAGAVIAVSGVSAHAGVLGAGDLVINSLALFNNSSGSFADPSQFNVTSDSRTGAVGTNFNGVGGTGAGEGSITGFGGAPIDVAYRCAGPQCGAVAGVYIGPVENNQPTKLSTPALNFALGDMFVTGSLLTSNANGLTRADVSITGGTNQGGSSATIQNSASVSTTFSSNTSFLASILLNASAYATAFVDPANPLGTTAAASGGFGFNITIRDVTAGFPVTTILEYSPAELNVGLFSSTAAQNQTSNFVGNLQSASALITGGRTYNLVINQSSNATAVQRSQQIPEPGSLALVGAALVGLAVVRRRKAG